MFCRLKVLFPLCESLLTPPRSADISSIGHCGWPKVGALLKVFFASFSHSSYEWLKWCYFILNATYDDSHLTMAYFMAPLHSVVDGLRIKNGCNQREVVTLRVPYGLGVYVLSSIVDRGVILEQSLPHGKGLVYFNLSSLIRNIWCCF